MFRSSAKAIFQSDESSLDDTDEDFSEKLAERPKKRRKALTGSTLNLQRCLSDESGGNGAATVSKRSPPTPLPTAQQSPRMGNKSASRKVNTVWSDLATEEQLISGLDGSLQVKKQRRGLGVESYAYNPANILQHSPEKDAEGRSSGTSADQEVEVAAEKSSQDSGDSAKETDADKPKKDAEGGDDQKMDENRPKSTRNFRKRRVMSRYKQKFPMNFRIKITEEDKQFDPSKEQDGEKLRHFVNKLSEALHEHKRDLLEKCVKQAGVEKCALLLQKTCGIEKYGGWLTIDEKRRRTPGGVFLSLFEHSDVLRAAYSLEILISYEMRWFLFEVLFVINAAIRKHFLARKYYHQWALLKQDDELTDDKVKAIFGQNREEKAGASAERKILTAKRTAIEGTDTSGFGAKKKSDSSFEKSLQALKKLTEERKSGGSGTQIEQEGECSSETKSNWKTRAELHLEECSTSGAFLENEAKFEDSAMEQPTSSSSSEDN
uniref:Phosphorylated adapter RNA export protein n=1 Tax=Romanomermis culicivorax TaxID=13658 RepID=A0A915HXW6_ROMCU